MKKLALLLMVLAAVSCNRGPKPFEVARTEGNKLMADGDYEGAAAKYEESLKLDPDQEPKAYDRAAFARMKAKQFDAAADLLEKSVAHRSDADDKLATYRNIAGMYLQQANDLDNAERYFQKAMALDPKDEQSLGWLAEISSIRGGARVQTAQAKPDQLDIALQRYDQLIALNPKKPDAFVNKRIALVKYITYLQDQKLVLLADADDPKNKETREDLQKQAADAQTHIDQLKVTLEETGKKLGEAMKAAKGGK